MPHHQSTIHLNCESIQVVHDAYHDYTQGRWSRRFLPFQASMTRPALEMTIPSSVDRSIVKGDGHVVLLFTQYTPYTLADGEWDDKKEEYAKMGLSVLLPSRAAVFADIDCYAPNFSKSVVGYEVLPPPELEKTFGITGGVCAPLS